MKNYDSSSSGVRMSRRALLGSAATGGAFLISGCGSAESQPLFQTPPSPSPAPPAQFPAPYVQLFEAPELNYQALFLLGSAGVCSEMGEALTAVDQANQSGGDAAAFFTAFQALAASTAASAQGPGQATARARYLRAAKYYSEALYTVYASPTPGAEAAVYQAMNQAWTAAAGQANPAWEKIAIPYEGGTLPGWLLTPPGPTVARPTVIITNGSDGQNADIVAYGPLEAVQRGYNAVLYDGPGQGESFFVHNLPFRPDWEKVVTPLVDYLLTRPEVDPMRIALTGWSMGGDLVARAAAFEPRLAAVVSDGGVYSPWLAFPEELREIAEAGDKDTVNGIWLEDVLPAIGPVESFALKKRFSIFSAEAQAQARAGQVPTDFFTLSNIVKSFDISSILGQITQPYLVLDYEGEAFYPGQAQVLFNALAGPKDFHLFSGGARYHCAPMTPNLRNEVVFDWLDSTLGV